MRCIQEKLPLFAPPSFNDILLERGITTLTIAASNRLKTSWHLTQQPVSRRRTLTVPSVLSDAPANVKEALVDWALLPWRPRRSRGAGMRERKHSLESIVWEYLAAVGHRTKHRAVDPKVYRDATRGTKYDLAEVLARLNESIFHNRVHTYIRWGSYASTTSYQTTRCDPKGTPYSLITIAGAYDHPDVPRFALEAVVYHEMLHVIVPSRTRGGRTLVHTREFRAAERAFPHYRRWRQWEKAQMARVVRSLCRKRRHKR